MAKLCSPSPGPCRVRRFLPSSLLKVSTSPLAWAGPGARHSGERGAEALGPRLPMVLLCRAGGDRVPQLLVRTLLGLASSRRAADTGPAGYAALTSLSRGKVSVQAGSSHEMPDCSPFSGVGPATCHYVLRWGWFCISSVSQVLLVPELLIISSTCNPQRIRKLAGCGPLVCSVGSHLLPLLPAYTLSLSS